ncbi:MAG TPA: hypothetical protein VNU97_08805 [Rhizomicrobium sp.]|jgi:hypothetical protein|nr:hypothetical protein [Rhizomicrobium sp.]
MVRKPFHLLAVLAALALSGAGASAADLTRLPARFLGHDVYLQVRLNGAAPVWMKFDVGAAESSVSAATIAGDARHAARVSVQLGPVALPGVYFDVAATEPGLAPDGTPLAGRLGEDSLGDRILVIRYRDRTAWLSPPVSSALTVAAR